MTGTVLLSTAYLPPIEFFACLERFDKALIEREENYVKQTYRNRCYIISANGIQMLTIPVLLGSFHKTSIKNIRIDNSKRWQHIHIRALVASYRSSPFFMYYFDTIEKIINSKHNYLLDLNMELIMAILDMMKMNREISFTSDFKPPDSVPDDFRYRINPKKPSSYMPGLYQRVFEFETDEISITRLSIIDLLFNKGPEALTFL